MLARAAVAAACTAAPAAETTRSVVTFATRTLDRSFVAEGAGIGDLDGDGHADLVAGPWWYRGPAFDERHEFMPAKAFDPAGYSNNFFVWVADVNDDGRNDIVLYGFPGQDASWFENPGTNLAAGHWSKHVAVAELDNESPAFTDITGDGKPEIVGSVGGFFGYATPGPDPRRPWAFHRISPQVAGERSALGAPPGGVLRTRRRTDARQRRRWRRTARRDHQPRGARLRPLLVPGRRRGPTGLARSSTAW